MNTQNEKKFAGIIVELANHTAKNTIGKSIPLLAHEVQIPEKLRKNISLKK